MDIDQFINATQDAIHVRRVYADPVERDGATVIVAARVGGGAGGGSGMQNGEPGECGGYGIGAAPAGAFVIRGGDVRWVPAINPALLVATVGAVVVAVVAARSWTQVRLAKLARA